jgi:hypothetical protein
MDRSFGDLLKATAQMRLRLQQFPAFCIFDSFGLDEAIAVTMPVTLSAAGPVSFDLMTVVRPGLLWHQIRPGSSWNTGGFLSMAEGVVVGQHHSYAAVVSDQAVVINPSQPTLRQMRGVSLNTDGSGWIVGDNATIFRTQNSGVTWDHR